MIRRWRTWLATPSFDSDPTLEDAIRDSLAEERRAQPPGTALERLYKAILDRQPVRLAQAGMWVLNEPMRDPPDATPMLLTGHAFKKAQRLYAETRGGSARIVMAREVVWSNMAPSFSAIMNW